MENSGEDLSSTASHSFSGDGGSASSEESGWTSYIDYFMETQQQQRRKEEVSRRAGDPSTDDAGAGRRCSYTSECSSDTGVGASTWLPVLAEPSVVSRRLSLREGWRRKKVMYDAATSPINSPKVRAYLQAYYYVLHNRSLCVCVCVCLFCTCKIWIVFGLLGDLVQFAGGRSKFYCMVSVD
jgi:hypothetical protein